MDLQDLVPVAVGFVVVGIVLAFSQNIIGSIRDGFDGTTACGLNSSGGTGGTLLYTGCNYDYNSSTSTLQAQDNIAQKLPLLGLVIAAALIIGILLKAFRG